MSVGAEEIVVALYDYTAKDPEELSIRKNEQLILIEAKFAWWKVHNGSGKFGLVPSNYLRRDKGKGESLVNRIANKLPGKKGKISNPPGGAAPVAGGGGGGGGKGLLNPTSASAPVPTPSNQLNEEYISKFDYVATKDDELNLTKGMCVLVLKTEEDGWWYGKDANRSGNPGWFPSNYVTKNVQSTAPNNINTLKSPTNENGNCLMVVRALYPFHTDNGEELGFEQDELLDIIEDPPDDPEWYLAKNSDGNVGLVPKNYVEIASDAHPVSNQNGDCGNARYDVTDSNNHKENFSCPLANAESKDWFFGPLKRSEAETLLNGEAKNGEFLVRNCETAAGEFSISMKMPGRIRHFKIIVLPDGQYGIGQKRFESIENLLDHYKRSPIFTNSEQGKFYLTNPLPR